MQLSQEHNTHTKILEYTVISVYDVKWLKARFSSRLNGASKSGCCDMLKLWDVEIARSLAVSRIAFIFYGENATNLISARAVRRTPLWGSPQDPLQIVEC